MCSVKVPHTTDSVDPALDTFKVKPDLPAPPPPKWLKFNQCVASHCQHCLYTSCINTVSIKLSTLARASKNLRAYLCIFSLLSVGLVRVCNRTLASLSLYIVN